MTDQKSEISQVILLTGATSGIGRSFAEQLARKVGSSQSGQQAGLIITGRDQSQLEAMVDEFRQHANLRCVSIVADLSDPETPERLMEFAVGQWGRLDVLVNNAGYGLPRMFHKASVEELKDQIQVDFTAPLLLTRLALPHLVKSQRGLVIQVSSSISHVAYPIFGAYGACKAGLSYFSDALRREFAGTGVKVCLVEPGPIRTQFLSRATDGLSEGDPKKVMIDQWPGMIFGTPERVASDMIRCLGRPKSRIFALRRAVYPLWLAGVTFRLFPSLGDWLVGRSIRQARLNATQESLA